MEVPSTNPVFRYLAIVKAAGDFGLDQREIARVVTRVDPFDFDELAGALAEALLKRA